MQSRVSLAELLDADVPVRPDEAVAILREVCRQYAAGDLHGIPNLTVIRLTRDGHIAVEGPVNRDQAPVPAAASLLAELLPGFESSNGFRVPGGLRLVLARATRTLDLPPFADMAEFCAALERFAASDPASVVRHLFAAWSARQHPGQPARSGELTISDVRRARRATGLTLEDIGAAAGLDAARLRELEWGYTRNWPADDQSREDLRRYAGAAGLDESLVVSVAWPLIEHPPAAAAAVVEAAPVPADTSWALVPAATEAITPLPWTATPRPTFIARYRWALALAAAILIAIVGLVSGWEWQRPDTTVAVRTVPVSTTDGDTVAASAPPAVATTGEDAGVRSAALVTSTPAPAPAPARVRPAREKPARAKAARAPAPAPQRKSFFSRELFRIVIK